MKLSKINLLIIFVAFTFIQTASFADNIETVLSKYKVFHRHMVEDKFAQAKGSAEELKESVLIWIKENTEASNTQMKMIVTGCENFLVGDNSDKLHEAFGVLSQGLVDFVKANANLQPNLQLFYCPMTPTYGFWVQPKGETIANPYYGPSMLTCGTKKKW